MSIDGRVLLFALGATLVAGIVFGLSPAIRGTRFDLGDSLKSGGRGSADEAIARGLEPGAVVSNATTLEQAIATQFVAPRFYMLLVGVFAGVSVVLAAVGVYGVMSQLVASRTREIGVRLALGAGRRQILALVMASGLRLAVVGSLIGIGGAVASARYLQTLLFGVEATDPATLTAVAFTLIAVACAASYVPARRAIAVDPMTAVRCE